ncbi:MAG: hypothetical protein Kow00104_15190 [Rhodothalassiaceae bacterium]
MTDGQPDMTIAFEACDEADVEAVARRLAPLLAADDVLLLEGPLGAGKTVFARALIRARCEEPAREVESPSFALALIHEPAGGPVLNHVDLYRIEDPRELVELGLEDMMAGAITLIEWPGHGPGFAAFDPLLVTLGPRPDGRRDLRLRGGGRWQDRLRRLGGTPA